MLAACFDYRTRRLRPYWRRLQPQRSLHNNPMGRPSCKEGRMTLCNAFLTSTMCTVYWRPHWLEVQWFEVTVFEGCRSMLLAFLLGESSSTQCQGMANSGQWCESLQRLTWDYLWHIEAAGGPRLQSHNHDSLCISAHMSGSDSKERSQKSWWVPTSRHNGLSHLLIEVARRLLKQYLEFPDSTFHAMFLSVLRKHYSPTTWYQSSPDMFDACGLL